MEILNLEISLIPCFSKLITGLDCPGCGLQRSLFALFAGDIRKSFEFYPPVFLIISTFLVLALSLIIDFRFRLKILVSFYILSLISITINYILKFIN